MGAFSLIVVINLLNRSRMYKKWNNTIQTFLSGKKVPQISQQLKQIFDKLWREVDESTLKATEGLNYKQLNRYSNILPYNKNRVKLVPPFDQGRFQNCDYINASHIKNTLAQREYIMCQGPLENTCEAFWKMVVQNKVKMIVMLGNFEENKREKVFEYLPLTNSNDESANNKGYKEFDSIKVQCLTSKDIDSIMTERTLEITEQGTDEKHACIHCHFSSWSDFGVPAKVEYLETLLNYVNSKRVLDSSPLVIHCSAGVGRSGVFVYCDIVLALLSQSTLESVAYVEELLELRGQRMKSIQTFQQFVYALQVLRLMYPKVANWGTLSPVKTPDSNTKEPKPTIGSEHNESDKNANFSPSSLLIPTLNSTQIGEKRKFQCMSEIVGLESEPSETETTHDDDSQAKKPPPCPIRTTSLGYLLKSKSVDHDPSITSSPCIDEAEKDQAISDEYATNSDPVMFMTPNNQSEKAKKSFFGSLNKTDSKLMMKSKSLTKRKLGSSLRKNLMTKFKRIDKSELSVVAKPVNFD